MQETFKKNILLFGLALGYKVLQSFKKKLRDYRILGYENVSIKFCIFFYVRIALNRKIAILWVIRYCHCSDNRYVSSQDYVKNYYYYYITLKLMVISVHASTKEDSLYWPLSTEGLS